MQKFIKRSKTRLKIKKEKDTKKKCYKINEFRFYSV